MQPAVANSLRDPWTIATVICLLEDNTRPRHYALITSKEKPNVAFNPLIFAIEVRVTAGLFVPQND